MTSGGPTRKEPREAHNTAPNPSGCRWCGIEQRDHFQRWKPPAGWHKWEQPTQDQIKDRMLARRDARKATQ